MAAPKKPGGNAGKGRPKGSRNKRTLEVREKLDALGCDPIEGLARLAAEATDPEFKRRCLADLVPYYAPRLQATKLDVSADFPNGLGVTVKFVDAPKGED